MGLIFLFVLFACVIGEESWFTTFHQLAQRESLNKQNQIKMEALNNKEKMVNYLGTISTELQLLNKNIASFLQYQIHKNKE